MLPRPDAATASASADTPCSGSSTAFAPARISRGLAGIGAPSCCSSTTVNTAASPSPSKSIIPNGRSVSSLHGRRDSLADPAVADEPPVLPLVVGADGGARWAVLWVHDVSLAGVVRGLRERGVSECGEEKRCDDPFHCYVLSGCQVCVGRVERPRDPSGVGHCSTLAMLLSRRT